MEVHTEVPQSGTRLRIDADRQFDGNPGDSTLRIMGQTEDGSQVFDATYVECAPDEATLVGWFLRSLRQPAPELLEKITQEVQAAFGARLTGRDARQVADLAWQGIALDARRKMGLGAHASLERIETLAERFERASARGRAPSAATGKAGARE